MFRILSIHLQLKDAYNLVISYKVSPVPVLSFRPAPYRGWTRAGEKRAQDNLHAHAQSAAIFAPKSREKPYLEVLFRFGLWRDFLNDNNNIQATISVFRLVNNMSINAKSVECHRCHAKSHSISFYHNIKDNERNLCQDLLTIENTKSDLKVHACIMQMSYLYASDFPFKNFCKLAQHGETIRKKCLRVQTTINHICILSFLCFFFYHNINFKEKGIARHIDASSVVWTLVIFDWFVLSMRMQVILDSLFASPGSAPIRGREEIRVQDWTS